jgi:hypothetical protein
MPLVPLQLPPGVYRNGTEYQAQGRWHDASLVRWIDGTMRPVGGWQQKYTLGNEPPRGCVAWRSLGNSRYLAVGSASKLLATLGSTASYVGSAIWSDLFLWSDGSSWSDTTIGTLGAALDITPLDLTSGLVDAGLNEGYSGGFYGAATYGTPRPDTGFYIEATTWSLDNWGEYLVACSSTDGRLLEWQLDPLLRAAPISGAPINNLGLMVTEERFLVALGAGGNPRKVQWSDREDNTTWTPASTNEAGDIELQGNGQIMQAVRTRGQTLVLTDQDAHTMTYQGPPFVYGFERVGTSCGALSRKAAVSVDSGVYWMGPGGFYRFSGGAVQEIPSEVADYVFSSINSTQVSKLWGVANSQTSEIWWFYASGSSVEVDRYVSYNYQENHWSIGSLSRTTGVDAGVFKFPTWFDAIGTGYDHERGVAYGGATIFAESGPVQLGAGDQVLSAVELIPDERTQGDVSVTFSTRFHPNDTERTYGPYSMANPTPVRFTGRQATMKVQGATLSDWRFGVPRLDVRAGGRR